MSKNNNVIYACDSCKSKYLAFDIQVYHVTLQHILQYASDILTDTKGYNDDKISVVFKKPEELLRFFKAEIYDYVSLNNSTGFVSSINTTTSKMLQSKLSVIVKPNNSKQISNTTKSELLKNVHTIKGELVLVKVRNIIN